MKYYTKAALQFIGVYTLGLFVIYGAFKLMDAASLFLNVLGFSWLAISSALLVVYTLLFAERINDHIDGL